MCHEHSPKNVPHECGCPASAGKASKLKAAERAGDSRRRPGSLVAYELAAAGIGRLILAHAGFVKPSDLNRQY